MKIIISPAKSLNFEDKVQTSINSQPFFNDDAIKINNELKKESIESLCNLMGISPKLGELNWNRNQDFKNKFGEGTQWDLDWGKLIILGLCIYIAFFKD